MATDEKVVAVVGLLCESFARKPTSATFLAYTIGLDGVSDAALDAAATRVLRSPGQFMPSPGQLRQLALTGGVTFEARADMAWLEFDAAVGKFGGDYSVTFEDGIINATARMLGGWVQCCEKVGDAYFVWLQKQFKETYIRMCQSPDVAAELRRPLVGRLEVANGCFPTALLEAMQPVYTGESMTVRTSQPVMLPATAPRKRIERSATEGPLRLGAVLQLPTVGENGAAT